MKKKNHKENQEVLKNEVKQSQSTKTGETKPDQAEEMQAQIDDLQNQLAEEKDKYIRLYAEFDNYRKRTNREKMDLIETASEEVIADLLPVLDDFERALTELKKTEEDDLYKGVKLIYDKFRKVLTDKGLKEIEVHKGDAFDADIHDAVAQIPGDKKMSGKIHDVIEKGYRLGNKIIRYPKVVTIQ